MTAATASFHLKELVSAELVRAQPQSRFIDYSANYAAMSGLIAYLTDNCCGRGGTFNTQCAPACGTAPDTADASSASPPSRRAGKSLRRRVA